MSAAPGQEKGRLAAATVRALKHPPFDPASFTATKWSTADDKVRFASHFVRFLLKDCPETLFTNQFYGQLHCCFGFCAEYNRIQYFETHFSTSAAKARFLDQVRTWPCFGDPAWTYSDVERAIIRRVRASAILAHYQAEDRREVEAIERALLAKLQDKYAPLPLPRPPPRDLFDPAE